MDEWNRTWNPEIDPHMYGAVNANQWRKDSPFNNDTGTIRYPSTKKINFYQYLIPHKKLTQNCS